ncbi:DUF4238 domain-containing protein [Pseudochryseolinea flava]|uniref:DUF4238 domain-containing protein n=1 Tax=Pseudochryseolinea flava TaxID=2059302 RepID=A0A364XTL5_9BACT|nr:DUF4238 domain-containing protein [Pseudochryseolinea flava]RAV97610.1 hypothetical protein DQQ10_27575 [Pseudochryseolinea flava]
MTTPVNQSQHKVPQVYLKKFGYKDLNNQWKVSVLKRGNERPMQKSIKSFTAEVNHFDIESDDPRIHRMFEKMNATLEGEYNNIVKEVESDGELSEKSIAYLLQFVAVQIVRSDKWRAQIMEFLEPDTRRNFLQFIIGHRAKDAQEFKDMPNQPFFQSLMDLPSDKLINRALLFFSEYLIMRIGHFEVVILETTDERPWYTSTDPVIVDNRIDKDNLEIFAKESEVYFPLTPKHLLYLHFKGSDDQVNSLRSLSSERIHLVEQAQAWEIQKKISANAHEFLVLAGEHREE